MTPEEDTGVREIAIIGAGSYGVAIAELAEACGYRVVAYFDDDASKFGASIDGVEISGPIGESLSKLDGNCAVAVAIGNNAVRLGWLDDAQANGHEIPTLISPHAIVSPKAQIDAAVYLHPASHVWTHARIGRGSILSPHATVAHHTVLADGCFISTGANVGASIQIERESFVGIGAIVSTGVKLLSERTLVGAGAVVIRDTEPGGVYVGSPAHLLKVRDRER